KTSVESPPPAAPDVFPFRCELSLAPQITFWTQTSAYSEFGRGPLPAIVREKVKHVPEFTRAIEDLPVIGRHKALVDLMMTAMSPPRVLGAGVRSRLVSVPAARLLRHVGLPPLAHERRRHAPGPDEPRPSAPGKRQDPTRLRADPPADARA